MFEAELITEDEYEAKRAKFTILNVIPQFRNRVAASVLETHRELSLLYSGPIEPAIDGSLKSIQSV